MTILYQFAISHYCEKARWALDYKGIKFELKNLLPGPHILKTKKLAQKTSVPILVHDGETIQDSTEIITYLDAKYPEKSLTPQNKNLKKEAIKLEEYLDRNVGIHLRRYFYNTLLADKPLVTSLLLQNGPSYGPKLYAVIFPLVRTMMRKSMNINPEAAKRSEKKLTDALERLNQLYGKKKFLVGDEFTRADLTAASLLAPLCMPDNHDFTWPNKLPEPLLSYRKTYEKAPAFNAVLRMYKEYR